LKQLEEMGFIDKELNVKLVLKHKGDIIQIVQELINLEIPTNQ